MSNVADTIRDQEIEDLQRRVRELERRIKEGAPWTWSPVYPHPYPDCPPYPWRPNVPDWTRRSPYHVTW